MNLVTKWWDWCSQSLGHTFAGVTAPLLVLAGAAVVLFYASQGGTGSTALPPRSDIAGVCITTTPGATAAAGCAATVSPNAVQVLTPTPAPPTPTPSPRAYTVKAGDTLSRICANEAPDMALDACIAAIVSLSKLGGPDEITEGQALKLPPKGATSSSASSSAQPTATPRSAITALPPAQVVEEEEDVTEPLDEEVEEPADEPVDEPVDEPEDEPVAETPTEEELDEIAAGEYMIEDGDSLYGICATQVPDMDEDECVEFVVLLNNLDGPDEIRYGQVLLLP